MSLPIHSKEIESDTYIWLRGIFRSDLEFARKLRNANKQYFFNQNEISEAAQLRWYEEELNYNFYIIMKNVERIGTISIKYPKDSDSPAIIGNVLLVESERGKGYGKEAMKLAENRIMTSGREFVEVEVDLKNHDAGRFYHKLGYVTKSVIMRKKL